MRLARQRGDQLKAKAGGAERATKEIFREFLKCGHVATPAINKPTSTADMSVNVVNTRMGAHLASRFAAAI
jgi:hypothetical protein